MPKTPNPLLNRIQVAKIDEKPVLLVRDTGVRASDVLSELAEHGCEDGVLSAMPKIERDDIRACLTYAINALNSDPNPPAFHR